MKRTILWLGMLAIILAFGLTVVGCDDSTNDNGNGGGGTAIDGTWANTDYSGLAQEVSINGSNWSLKHNGTNRARGTISLSDPNATTGSASFTLKETWSGSSWVTAENQTGTASYVMGSQKTTITFSNVVGSWFNALAGTWTKK